MHTTERRFALAAFGVDFNITIDHRCDPSSCGFVSLYDDVTSMLPPTSTPRSNRRQDVATFGLTCEGSRLTLDSTEDAAGSSDSLEHGLHALDQAIRSHIAVHAPGLVFIHAGVVAFDARAIVLPGHSMAGKTTLVAALVDAGATYLSDEYAVIDEGGLVHPYARPLSIRDGQGRRRVSVEELGGTAAANPHLIGLVAAIDYEPGASWSVQPVDQAGCAQALVTNAVAAQIRPVDVIGVAALIARTVRCVEGKRGDTREAVPHLLELAER